MRLSHVTTRAEPRSTFPATAGAGSHPLAARRAARCLAALVLCVAVAPACGSEGPTGAGRNTLAIRAPTPAVRGTTIAVVLENTGSSALLFNECPTTLERRAAARWVAVATDWYAQGGCEAILRILEAGATYGYSLPLSTSLLPATYRLRLTSVWLDDAGRRGSALAGSSLISNAFELR